MSEHMQEVSEPSAPAIFEGYINEKEYCRQRGISLRTAQRDRQLRQSPPFITVGQKVMYRVTAVREWLLEQERRAERNVYSSRRGGRR